MATRPTAISPAAAAPVRLLFVEDDAVDRMAFERFLRREDLDYDCTQAGSLAEARELLGRESYDVVLADFNLGDGTAIEILKLGLDLPIIVVTGVGNEETVVNAMRAGAYDYLIKDVEHRYLKMVPVTIENALRQHASKQEIRMLSQAMTCINDCTYVTDLADRFIFVNETFCLTYGYSAAEIEGRTPEVLWADDGEQDLPPGAQSPLPPGGEKGECWHRRRDGSRFAVLLSRSAIVDDRGVQIAVVGVVRDISDRKHWETALRESEERYALAAAGANDGLWDWDLKKGEIYFSPRWKATLGYGEKEIGTSPEDWFRLVHKDDIELLRAQIDTHLGGRRPHFENEHRMRTRDSEFRWVQVRGMAVRDGAGEVCRMAGSLRDISDHKRIEEQLTHAALHDALTGLPNRALFMDRLDGALMRSKRRDDYAFGVIYLDLDRFKVLNESLGHQSGDQLLRIIARRLESCLRFGDTVARLGGDEFAILLDDLNDAEEVDRVAARVHEELRAPFQIDGREFFTTASIGIALSTTGYHSPEEILRDADIAMYRAKSLGRTDRVVFEKDMHTRVVELLHLETDLRRAVDRQEFRVHYQPIVELRNGRLRGFEALVRWQHPERGLLSPAAFLEVAQDTGLMVPIGWWVLGESCRQMKSWQKHFPSATELAVSVNLDGKQLASAELIDRVEEILAHTSLAPQSLQLEITEGMIIRNPTVTTAILARLRQREIALHIDDFGTGYSSLSQLHRFPIDSLKIDRSFVLGMSSDQENLEIVRAIVALAHNLGLKVTAEGV
ncbi:MAG: EAL domain-containing protein, partial [bacterium]|nr:EAL domain-containing protein [bacterium]